jgi:hypothetical protein
MAFLDSIKQMENHNLKPTTTNTKQLSISGFQETEPELGLDQVLTDYFFQADVDNWYNNLEEFTFKSDFVTLEPNEAFAIIKNWEKITKRGITEDDIQPTSKIPKELESLVQRIDLSIAKNFSGNNNIAGNGKVFIKLSSRSPKDSKTILRKASEEYYKILSDQQGKRGQRLVVENSTPTINDKLCLFSKLMLQNSSVSSGKEAVTIMLDSWRVAEDLMSAYDKETGKDLGYGISVVVRGWNPEICPKCEFRGFVINGELTCVGQYWHKLYFAELKNVKDQIGKDCLDFFNEKLKDFMPVPNAMLDLAWLGPGNVLLIEVNPLANGLGSFKASTGLFDYEEDVLQGKKPFEIRIRESSAKVEDLRYAMSKEWRKIVLQCQIGKDRLDFPAPTPTLSSASNHSYDIAVVKTSKQSTGNETLTKPRFMFISCTKLSHCWQQVPPEILATSLFLFGSKYSWVFPQTTEEVKDAKRQPGRYYSMDPAFLALIKEKYSRGEVHFLKSEELKYEQYPGPEDPLAYHRVNEWMTTVHGLPPLILDKTMWEDLFRANDRSSFQYCPRINRIVRNFTKGYHEYDELLQLIATSCQGIVVPRERW